MAETEIFETQDGSHSIFSNKFGVSYHSKYGAIQESRHVFIQAGLFHRILTRKEISILEIGFGTGLNAFMTLLATEEHELHTYYEAFELHPVSAEQAATLNYPKLLNAGPLSDEFVSLHDLPWNEEHAITDRFHFKKMPKSFLEIDHKDQFDLIYFDAFAPNAQPEFWEKEFLQKMYDALNDGGILVTYCAKGSVKRALKELGFQVEALKGPPGKREMTRGIK